MDCKNNTGPDLVNGKNHNRIRIQAPNKIHKPDPGNKKSSFILCSVWIKTVTFAGIEGLVKCIARIEEGGCNSIDNIYRELDKLVKILTGTGEYNTQNTMEKGGGGSAE